MSKVKLTPQQYIAATARGNALLVSAAAGSGKTMVLVQRLMNMICDEKSDIDITDFLVITYTRAAAAELKGRILQEINKRIAENPLNKKLRRQAMLCMKANISTIHGFCTELLRENAHLCELSPDFRVAEESETALLKAEVLENVLDAKYENINSDPAFKALAEHMVETRGDRKLSEAVLDAYEKLRSHPSPEKWMRFQEDIACFEGITDLSETVWGAEIIAHAKDTVDYCISKMTAALDEMHDYPDMLKAYSASFDKSIADMKKLRASLDSGWDAALEHCDVAFPSARISGYDYFKNIRTKCKDILKKEFSVFEGTSQELLQDMRHVSLEAKGLYSTIRAFDAEYSAEKKKRGIIDFSDQEHFALKLLYDFENECPSTLAKEVSERYVEVMVDEYQDVNAVQELIFSSVSRCQMNMFMVGDVKQSIYRFRMADPTIFLGKYQFFDDYEENFDGPQKVLLPENFRSRPEILNAVNYIFKNLMSSRFGEIDYTEKEYLRSGAEFEKAEENPVEYDILEVCDEDADDLVYAEAEYVAQKIRDMVNSEMKVPDKEGFRKVTFSDFAILLRSMKGRAWKYAVALNKFGVQADIPVADDFFETYEVSTVMSLLAVIDNPHQDIPLISVLRSPVFGFSLDELAEIRAANRKSDIFDAVSAKKDELVKCKKFIDELEYLREVSSEMSSDKFIWMLYSRTGILEMFSAAPDGEDRKENLVLLAELARKFEANGFKGLFRFVNQLKAMMEKGSQVAGSDGTGGSGVRIMSIHKSKGLEFPVVILADTTHRFNLQDTTKPVLFHAKLGLGLYRRVKEKRYKYPTLSRRAVSRRITLETMSEELRVLYVALTRAKHKLVMVSTVKDADKEFEKYWPSGEYPAPPTALENIKSYAGWLMTTMLTRPESASVYTPAEVRYAMPDDDAWCVRRVQYSPVEEHEDHQTAERAVEADADIKEHIKRNLEFKYPYSESSDIPSKLTATQLKGRSLDSEVSDGAPVYADRKFSIRKPDFARAEKPLTGSEKGTALHYVMQYIDYTKCLNTEDVKSELFRLVDKKFITQKQADAVKPESICRFFESSLGKSLLASDKIFREFKFSVLVSANEVMDTEADDKVLFQGVVDCFFEDQDGITVIDFKTDRITDFNYESKINTYSTQIKSYSKALERITEKKVKSSVLYFFDMNKAIEII